MDKNYTLDINKGPRALTNDPLLIPVDAYKDFKRCPHCQSVFIDDQKCDACGVNLNYSRVGDAYGTRSFYGIKEKYVDTLSTLAKIYPIFEDKNSNVAFAYTRHLTKRFALLIDAFSKDEIKEQESKRLFYLELKDLMFEMLEYGKDAKLIAFQIENSLMETHSLLAQELLNYLGQNKSVKNKNLLGKLVDVEIYFLSVKFWLFAIIFTSVFILAGIGAKYLVR